ncbi:sulfite exporter TauE/SafE family protein [Chitinivorax sp. B]|uniref:sulfite exporter TauE/SafE family protein n=1 Tax=Chitinivorax sp. B TaxID=2502235 RepID=UPI0010F93C17|nr:sulfite exporter TauE/SafE family protein [Chitinivorax sp. B]
MEFILTYLGIGIGAGFLAGLLGVGGGLIIVPLLVFCFERQGFHDPLHIALGTSLASILFTSLSSIRAHHGRHAVNWGIVKQITPGVLFGTFVGAWVAGSLPTRPLMWFFIVFIFYVASQMLLNIKPKPSRELPAMTGMTAAGLTIGGISSLVGIGGGSLSVPFMSWCNVKIHEAIGTSAAIGLPIALAGAAGYISSGWTIAGLPKGSLGYVYLPALAGIVITSMMMAGQGAKLAHKLPVAHLKKAFACLLLTVGGKMLIGMF